MKNKTELNANFLLSICIPTFNRSSDLKLCIDSIVYQKDFFLNNNVEIIVSDNLSNDNTKMLCKEYELRFGSKFKYSRNKVNIGAAKNLEKSLSLCNGQYLKLSNDTNIFIEGSISYILNSLRDNEFSNNYIYFTNNLFKNESKIIVNNLDEFVKKTSFYSTWILYYGVYKKQFIDSKSFDKVGKLNLINDSLYENIINSNKTIIYNEPIIKLIKPVIKKGNYNFFEVFVTNYLSSLKYYVDHGYIKKKTLFIEKHKLMVNHILPFSYSIFITKKADFKIEGALGIILKNFKYHPVMIYGLIIFILKKIFKIS